MDTAEYAFGIILHHAQFEYERRVEHCIGIFLIGKYPLVLTAAHARPAADCLLCSRSAILEIAYDAAQQAVVGRRHPVVVVNRQGRKGRHIEPELHLLGNICREFWIETVDTFNE